MKKIRAQPNIDYTQYIEYLKNKGYSLEEIVLDENSEIVTTQSLEKGKIGTVVDIRCPSRYKVVIAGKEQLPDIKIAHALVVRFANSNGEEIAPDTRIKIIKEKVSQALTTVASMFYKDITITEYLKNSSETKPDDKCKTYEKFYRFNTGIEINGDEHLKINVLNPDINIDSKNVKLSLDIDLLEEE